MGAESSCFPKSLLRNTSHKIQRSPRPPLGSVILLPAVRGLDTEQRIPQTCWLLCRQGANFANATWSAGGRVLTWPAPQRTPLVLPTPRGTLPFLSPGLLRYLIYSTGVYGHTVKFTLWKYIGSVDFDKLIQPGNHL